MVLGLGDPLCWELECRILNEWMCLLYTKGSVAGVEMGSGDRRGWNWEIVEGRNVGWIHFKQSWLFEGENSKSDCTLERKNIMNYGWFWMYLNTYKIFYLDYLLYHSGNQRDGLKFYLCINLYVYFLFMQISLGRLWPSRQHWEASQSIVG